jgi:hypothetical protein
MCAMEWRRLRSVLLRDRELAISNGGASALGRGPFYFADCRIACSAAKSSTDSFTAPPPVSDHQMLHVMQP